MIGPSGTITPGIAIRLVWAVLTALCLGAWLWQRSRSRDAILTPALERTNAWLRGALIALSGFWLVVWLMIALVRLPYPYELEWNGGAMLDHCERLLTHQPLYLPPSGGWFPYEYPPLYMAVCAFFMSWLGGPSYAVMRLVSIFSTLGCAGLITLWTRRLLTPLPFHPPPDAESALPERAPRLPDPRATRRWAFIAVGLFFVGYRLTGAWYDLERLDMLFLFLSLLGGYWLELATEEPFVVWRGSLFACLSAGALSLAFLTKQQAAFFLLGGVIALIWKRAWPQLILYSVMALALCGDAVWLLNSLTDGWFGYYCFRIPLANGIRVNLALQYIAIDLPLLAPTLAMLILAFAGRHRIAPPNAILAGARLRSGSVVLAAMTAMGVLGSFLLRAHWGGYENVLIPGYTLLETSACVAAGQWERARRTASVPLYLLFLAQFLALGYRPLAQIPTFANRAAGQRFERIIQALNTRGDVLCMEHGHVTNPRHFQSMGLGDVFRAERQLPPDLVDRIRNRRYSAIVMDTLPHPGTELNTELSRLILRYYAPNEHPQVGGPWVVTGTETPGPSGTIYILRPRF